MSNLAVTRGPELEQVLEQAQARFDVLRRVIKLRQDRSELLRQVAEIDHELAQHDEPLRVIFEERSSGAYRARFAVPRIPK